MNKKLVVMMSSFAVLLIGAIVMYLMMTPKAFYTKDEILHKMGVLTQEMEVQDVMQLDERTYFVPLLSNGEAFGTSIWVWSGWKWECVSESNGSGPHIVVNEGNSYIYWNVHPEDEIRKWEFYLTSERNYNVTSVGDNKQVEVYHPKIQMKQTVELGKRSYGYVKMPRDWKEVIGSFDLYPAETGYIPSGQSYLFQWLAYNSKGESVRLEHTYRNGGGGTSTGNHVQYMQQLDPVGLE
ncbi:hypothetical protein HF078_07265 [Bacillus sp. RO2]|uniref:hypothetical protein n=1 Tax=Bacillus sp. RO2 TaxID=2723913 RepID=UPI00145CFD07|nr:hypothetical protein [Bacillus sp. RO2]NMH72865.1 hypothetical protein [Bacillus sp. RO2]